MPEDHKSSTLGSKRRLVRLLPFIVAVLFLGCGVYLLTLIYIAPHRKPLPPSAYADKPKILAGQKVISQPNPARQLVIPSIGVKTDIAVDDLKMLDKGYVIQRSKSGGNPLSGGNFVLAGHRFGFGLSPNQVKRSSTLYDLDKLKVGDTVVIFWEHIRYLYKVKRLYSVKAEAIYVEQPTKETKLTIYTCTYQGASDGRLVMEAVPAK